MQKREKKASVFSIGEQRQLCWGERASCADGVAKGSCSSLESGAGIIVHAVLLLVPGKTAAAEIQMELLCSAFVCSEFILCCRIFSFGFGLMKRGGRDKVGRRVCPFGKQPRVTNIWVDFNNYLSCPIKMARWIPEVAMAFHVAKAIQLLSNQNQF